MKEVEVFVTVPEHSTDVSVNLNDVSATVPEHRTEVQIDPFEVLEALDVDDIENYLDLRNKATVSSIHWDYQEIIDSYYHGDFDLKKLLTELKMNDLVTLLENKNAPVEKTCIM
jgi:hypothetical protein